MNIVATGTTAEQDIARHFAAADAGALPPLLGELRQTHYRRLAAQGLPNRRVEAWKYTDLRRLMQEAYPPALDGNARVSKATLQGAFRGLAGARAVLVNGHFRADLSDLAAAPDGVELHSLAELAQNPPAWFRAAFGMGLGEDDGTIASLNAAFARDGVVIRATKEARADAAVHLVCLFDGAQPVAAHSRNLVVAEDGASITLLESHAGKGAYQSTTVLELVAGKDARIEHVKMQQDSRAAVHLHLLGMRLGENAACRSFALSLGAALARNQVQVALAGEHAHAAATGAFLLRGGQHCDTTVLVDHVVPHCTSSQLFKGVLDGRSRGVFQGKIVVRPHAQKTDGYQSSRALLLSDEAQMNSKPELEIFADDVKCSHGSTTGKIDEELMFYLRSRGISEQDAKSMLVQAFIGEALEQVGDEAARDVLSAAATRWMAAREDGSHDR